MECFRQFLGRVVPELHPMMSALLLVRGAPCLALARLGIWSGLEIQPIKLAASDHGPLRLVALRPLRADEEESDLAIRTPLEELSEMFGLSRGQANTSTETGLSHVPPDELT